MILYKDILAQQKRRLIFECEQLIYLANKIDVNNAEIKNMAAIELLHMRIDEIKKTSRIISSCYLRGE